MSYPQFLEELYKFTKDARMQIIMGIDDLPIEKVAIFADRKYDAWQMIAIRKALLGGLDPKKMEPYLNPEYSNEHMRDAFKMLFHYFPEKDIERILKIPSPIERREEIKRMFSEHDFGIDGPFKVYYSDHLIATADTLEEALKKATRFYQLNPHTNREKIQITEPEQNFNNESEQNLNM